jgi:hypothetical protein
MVKTRRRGGGLTALQAMPLTPSSPGGLSAVLPVTDWGRWTNFPSSHQWSSTTSAPAALANGGLYTNPQSTGEWASSPFPATQQAFALEAAKVSGLPEVAYHQRPNDNYGASFSPMVGTQLTPNHWSVSGPAGPMKGGSNKDRKNKNRKNRKTNKNNGKIRKTRKRWF